MGKPAIFIDFDQVVVKTISAICKLYNEDFRSYKKFEYVNPDSVKTYGFDECKCASPEIINTYFNTPRFFEVLEFMDGAEEILKLLSKDFRIGIVSHGFSPNLSEKKLWISKHIPYVYLIGVNLKHHNDKSNINMENCIFVDDKVSNLDSSNAKHKIIFGKKYPWNEDEHGYTRCENWYELYKEIIRLTDERGDV